MGRLTSEWDNRDMLQLLRYPLCFLVALLLAAVVAYLCIVHIASCEIRGTFSAVAGMLLGFMPVTA